MTDDWKQKLAEDADGALKHDLVTSVIDEYIDNMSPVVDLSKGLPRYGLTKIAHYVAIVARAQALGIDPDLVRLSATEANKQMLALAKRAAISRGARTRRFARPEAGRKREVRTMRGSLGRPDQHPIIIRMPDSCVLVQPFNRQANLEIPDYPTAIALIKSISDAAEAYLREKEERGE